MLSKLRDIFAEEFGEDIRDEIDEEASMETVSAWDSLSFIKVMIGLEQKFGISIDPDDAMQLTSIRGILELLEQKVA